jgi:hypothetical protein
VSGISKVARPRRNVTASADSRVLRVGIGLDVGISKRTALALHDRFDVEGWVVLEEIRKSLANGEVDGFDVDIMLENNDTVVGEVGTPVQGLFKTTLVRDRFDTSLVDGDVDKVV